MGHDHHHDSHDHVHEHYADRAHPEFVVLEIGNDLGAVIVYTGPELHGKEIEISRSGEDAHRSHKDVLERRQAGEPSFTAVFDKVEAGVYRLWVDDVARASGVVVAGGTITELDWRTAPITA
jgi:hypothetical protein